MRCWCPNRGPGHQCPGEGVIMKRTDLAIFFGLEVFAIIWAAAVFSLLSSHLLAGGLAGGYFVISGIFMLGRANLWPQKWSSLTWLVSRFAQMSLGFEDVRILGIPGPVFHNISSGVFSCLMIATAVDWLRSWWAARRNPHEVK